MGKKVLSRRQTGIIWLVNPWTYCTDKARILLLPPGFGMYWQLVISACFPFSLFLNGGLPLVSCILFFLYCSVLWELGHITHIFFFDNSSFKFMSAKPWGTAMSEPVGDDGITRCDHRIRLWGRPLWGRMNACHPKCINGKNGVMSVGQPNRWTILNFLYWRELNYS